MFVRGRGIAICHESNFHRGVVWELRHRSCQILGAASWELRARNLTKKVKFLRAAPGATKIFKKI